MCHNDLRRVMRALKIRGESSHVQESAELFSSGLFEPGGCGQHFQHVRPSIVRRMSVRVSTCIYLRSAAASCSTSAPSSSLAELISLSTSSLFSRIDEILASISASGDNGTVHCGDLGRFGQHHDVATHRMVEREQTRTWLHDIAEAHPDLTPNQILSLVQMQRE